MQNTKFMHTKINCHDSDQSALHSKVLAPTTKIISHREGLILSKFNY